MPANVAVCPAAWLSVRALSDTLPLLIRRPPLALVTPLPLIVPPLQVSPLITVRAADPVNVPAVWVKVPTVASAESEMVTPVFKIAVSAGPGIPLSRFQFSGLNQLVSAPPPASQT